MKITLSGASGFIGSSLNRTLRARGHDITSIPRGGFSKPDALFCSDYINGHEVVINLAGAPVSGRWTDSYKRELYDSRILTTRKITTAIGIAQSPPECFINASAVGIYTDRQKHTEESTDLADHFLGKLIHDWESEARKVSGPCRVVILRQGLVLAKDEGALEKMSPPFKMGIGAKVGSGNQGLSWIHLDDLMEIYLWIIKHPEIEGVVNAVGEYPTDNFHFSEMLGRMFGQPVYFTVPKFVLKWIYGEGAVVLTDGQKVLPEKLLGSGFRFLFPTIDKALVAIYRDQPATGFPSRPEAG